MNESGPDRYCPTCGYFPENAAEEEDAPIGKCCPSCGCGTIKPTNENPQATHLGASSG
jgi:hypothetical protein